jgi:rare lipoprotein A
MQFFGRCLFLFVTFAAVQNGAYARPHSQTGIASFYAAAFAGKKTATGAIFRPSALTMAHRTARLNTWAKVTNVKNHRSVIVKINDRGPYKKHRIADLSREAARRLKMLTLGLAKVRIVFLAHNPRHHF